MKLSLKILLLLVVSAFLTVGIVGGFVFFETREDLQKSIGENQLQIALETMNQIDRSLYGAYQDIQIVAKSDAVEEFMAGGNEEEGELRRELRELTLLTGPWDILFIVDDRGVAVLATDEDEISEHMSEDPQNFTAYQAALENNIYYSDLVISEETHRPTIIFAAPIRDELKPGRPVVGAVIGNLSWPIITEILDDIPLAGVLVNNEGTVIYDNEPKHSDSILNKNLNQSIVVQHILEGRTASIIHQDLHGNTDSKGVVVDTLISHVPQLGYLSYRGSGWWLLLEQPVRVAFAPATVIAFRLLFIAGVLIAVVFGLVLLLIRFSVISPIKSLTLVSKAIADGDFKKRADVSSKDEIGQLAQNFNSMVFRVTGESILRKSIIDALPGALFLTDTKGIIQQINPTVIKTFGYSEEDIRGKSIVELFPAKTTTTTTTTTTILQTIGLDELAKTGSTKDRLVSMVAKDGTEIPVTLFGRIVKKQDSDNEKTILFIAVDRRAAQALEKAKTEFVAIASHQLRSPLTVTKGNIEMMLNGEFGDISKGQREVLTEVFSANENLVQLVSDMLDVTKIERGMIELNLEDIDLAGELGGVIKHIIEYAKKHDVSIQYHKPEQKLPIVVADKGRIQQIFQNLIDNAIRYSRHPCDEGCRIDISITVADGHIEVKITDNGIGIPKDEQKEMFKRFSRASNAVKFASGGSGLGLYVVKSLVEQQKGDVRFESEENKGTTFYVTLPIKQS